MGFGFRVSIGPGEVKSSESVSGFGFRSSKPNLTVGFGFRVSLVETNSADLSPDHVSILPNSSRVSLLTYKAIVVARYPELVLHDQDPIQIGHFVAHDNTVEYGGFRTVLWDAPKDLRTAVEDVVV